MGRGDWKLDHARRVGVTFALYSNGMRHTAPPLSYLLGEDILEDGLLVPSNHVGLDGLLELLGFETTPARKGGFAYV